MWSLFRSAAPRPAPTRARLSLESLDSRSAPSTVIDPVTGAPVADYVAAPSDGSSSLDPIGTTPPAPPAPPANQAPQIVNFSGRQDTGNIWVLSGDVLDEAPGGLTITFGGEPISLQGKTVTTDSAGHFELVIALKTDGSDNGVATAETVDKLGAQSNVAECGIYPSV
jgi:hypothetical protein